LLQIEGREILPTLVFLPPSGLRKILRVSWTAKKTHEWVLNKAGVKRELLRHRQSKEASILWSHREETRELPGERDNARNNARCTQARKTTHGLDGQHQDMDRTPRGRVSQNDSGQREMEKVHCTSMVWPTLGSRTTTEQNGRGMTEDGSRRQFISGRKVHDP